MDLKSQQTKCQANRSERLYMYELLRQRKIRKSFNSAVSKINSSIIYLSIIHIWKKSHHSKYYHIRQKINSPPLEEFLLTLLIFSHHLSLQYVCFIASSSCGRKLWTFAQRTVRYQTLLLKGQCHEIFYLLFSSFENATYLNR